MRFGRFAGLLLSLFLPAFYRDVARNWGGIGFLYLLLLFTLTWIPVLAKMQLVFQKSVREELPKVANKLPDITIKAGKVSSPVAQPFEIKDEQGKTVFVLDTTGKINTLDQTPAMILITENKLHSRDQQKIQIHDLSQFPDFEFTADWVKSWVDFLGAWLGVGLFPFVMIGSLIRALIIMMIASLAGLIFNAIFSANGSYAGLLRFAAVGMTLSVYIDTGLMLADFPIPFWFLIALALTTAYVAFGTAVSAQPIVMDADDRMDREEWRRPGYTED